MTYNKPTTEELLYIDSIKGQRRYGRDEQVKLYSVYNRLFNDNARPGGCGRCLAGKHKALLEVLKREGVPKPVAKRGRPKKQA